MPSVVVRLLFVLAAILTLVACGGEPESAQPPSATVPTTEREGEAADEEATGADRYSGQAKDNYEMAEDVCGAFPPAKVASDLGLEGNRGRSSEELVAIAEKYAEGYQGPSQQAAFSGCLAGLPDAAE